MQIMSKREESRMVALSYDIGASALVPEIESEQIRERERAMESTRCWNAMDTELKSSICETGCFVACEDIIKQMIVWL